MTSDDVVRQVKDLTDIAALVGRYVSLTKRGKNYVALCPFHSEKTPSFTVSPDKEFFHCFGCGKGGDVFAFVMEMEGIDFPEALRMLAQETGVKIPERRSEAGDPSPYADIYEANQLAAAFYHRMLLESDAGAGALAYLKGRGVEQESIDAFRIGYAPPAWDSLIRHAKERKVDLAVLVRSGLAIQGKEGIYDYFRQRIVFTILDNRGRLAGFAGREFGGTSPKYLNSPDTPIFSKGKILYGYHQARSHIRASGEVLIVEGYLDLITLVRNGIRNVVAPMGTALTEDQARSVSRVARTAILVYDRDEAGLRATFRAGDIFLRTGMGVKVVMLPSGEDPDSFVRGQGTVAFTEAMKDAQDVFDLKIRILGEKGLLDGVDGRRASVDHLLRSIAVTKDEVIRDIYMRKAAEATGIDRGILERRLGEAQPKSTPRRVDQSRGRPEPGLQEIEKFIDRYLIQLMIMGNEFLVRVLDSLSPQDFSDPLYQRAFQELSRIHETTGFLSPERVLEEIPEDLRPTISRLYLTSDEITDPNKILQDCLRKVEARKVEQEMSEIEESLTLANEGEEGLVHRYYQLKKRLIALQFDSLATG